MHRNKYEPEISIETRVKQQIRTFVAHFYDSTAICRVDAITNKWTRARMCVCVCLLFSSLGFQFNIFRLVKHSVFFFSPILSCIFVSTPTMMCVFVRSFASAVHSFTAISILFSRLFIPCLFVERNRCQWWRCSCTRMNFKSEMCSIAVVAVAIAIALCVTEMNWMCNGFCSMRRNRKNGSFFMQRKSANKLRLFCVLLSL